jgi:hypothetical protein
LRRRIGADIGQQAGQIGGELAATGAVKWISRIVTERFSGSGQGPGWNAAWASTLAVLGARLSGVGGLSCSLGVTSVPEPAFWAKDGAGRLSVAPAAITSAGMDLPRFVMSPHC